MTTVVLFDIDGTLLASGGVGRRAMEGALHLHFGTIGPDDYRYDGKTDRQIVRELMRLSGFSDDDIDARMDTLLADYLARLDLELADGPRGMRVHTGIPALLDALEARADVLLGLLTGNIAGGAALKLGAAGIAPTGFRVGAFGSDHEYRSAAGDCPGAGVGPAWARGGGALRGHRRGYAIRRAMRPRHWRARGGGGHRALLRGRPRRAPAARRLRGLFRRRRGHRRHLRCVKSS